MQSSRRSFIKSTSSLIAGFTFIPVLKPLVKYNRQVISQGVKPKVHIFSKHLQWLNYDEMSKLAKQIGFDGIDLTVRPKGHVLPERVKDDLPIAVNTIRNNGLLVDRITTSVTDPDDQLTHDILHTASNLGISEYRMGWYDYEDGISIQENILNISEKLNKFASLNEKLGLRATYQNHTGTMVGGPVWDVGLILNGVNPSYVGSRYDIRHATVEGGQSWSVGLKFLSDRIYSFDIKDFIWKKVEGQWKPFNVPLGEGMVDFDSFFQLVKELNIQGDFTIHMEYPIGGAEHGVSKLTDSPEVVISAMKHDLHVLKSCISSL